MLLKVAPPSTTTTSASDQTTERKKSIVEIVESPKKGPTTASTSLAINKMSSNSENMNGGYVSASSSFKSLTPTSASGHPSSSSDSEATPIGTTSRFLEVSGGEAGVASDNKEVSSDREDIVVVVGSDSKTSTLNNSMSGVSLDETTTTTSSRTIAVDEDFIKVNLPIFISSEFFTFKIFLIVYALIVYVILIK